MWYVVWRRNASEALSYSAGWYAWPMDAHYCCGSRNIVFCSISKHALRGLRHYDGIYDITVSTASDVSKTFSSWNLVALSNEAFLLWIIFEIYVFRSIFSTERELITLINRKCKIKTLCLIVKAMNASIGAQFLGRMLNRSWFVTKFW